ncbi:YwmB family TATA-box binding protein [Bacillus sp. ISL-47]|uniref:YwmB family TATA-box binding protein n=1 Tax=Bacillus sp. ISL-47 TaxID=2819130 RepID=UPI001BEB187E|nr:YwmB family TATA-box binding protein [Bacillus sp. ISL-47]MBT2690869.1 YwmB family TATA-box binding protein [Bacillus sp. ISL-47]MBT2710968.1 YwmB family TATA-box binding protein [Pseudomonas sp. ISL-84]
MKQAISSISLALILIFFYGHIGQGKEDNLLYILNSLDEFNANISEWSIYYKYNAGYSDSLSTFREHEAKLKKNYPNFQWEEKKVKDHHISITGKINGNNKREQIVLTALKEGNRYKILQTYSYTGENWSHEEYLKLTNNLDNRNNLYFTVKSKITPAQHQKLSDMATTILDKLSAKPVEQLAEEDFVSVSAYKNSWGNYLPTKNKEKMNLQLGLRQNPDEKLISLTIGSPIITIEY